MKELGTLWTMFLSFAKIGTFTLGGGYAMIPLIEREVVTGHKWIKDDEFLDMVVLAQTAPGILAMNISILVGNRIAGKRGAVVAALASGLPSFVIILLFAMFLTRFQDNEIVNKMFSAIRPAVVALIAVPVFSLAKGAKVSMKNVWIPVATAILIWGFSLSPIYIIIAAIIAGIAVAYYGIRTGRAAAKQERQMQEKHNDTVAEDKQ